MEIADFFWFSDAKWPRIEALPPSAELVADKGYDSQALREWLDERGTRAVIPPRKSRKVQNFMGAAALAAAVIWWLK